MPIVSIGDMSQHFMSLQNGGQIKSDLARLGQELSTGKSADVVEKLSGQTRQLSAITHTLDVLGAYQQSVNETALTLDHMQISLERVEQHRDSATNSLLLISSQSQPHQISLAGATANQAFEGMVSALNGQLAGRSLFAGAAVDRAPLADAKVMLDDLRANLATATNQTDVETIFQQWFDDPAGGFATMGYLGDTSSDITCQIGPDQTIDLSVRADNSDIKDLLRASALGALAGEMTGRLTQVEQANLLRDAGTSLFGGSAGLVQTQASVGSLQGVVDIGQTRIASEQTSLSMAYNDLTTVDPFETAARLQAVQLQLETHFAVTARLSRLTLAEYI